MFYRLRFDGLVGGILRKSGFDTNQMLEFWPTGTTAEWVKLAKSKSWTPIEAAALAVSHIALQKVKLGQISSIDGQLIAGIAQQAAQAMGAREPVLAGLTDCFCAIFQLSGSRGVQKTA